MVFKSKVLKLQEILSDSIQTGFQARGGAEISSSHKGKGYYSLIQVKDADKLNYSINTQSLSCVFHQKEPFMRKYILQKQDVLYLSKLDFCAFRLPASLPENTVPTAHFYILRPQIKYIDPDYLCWALNQDFLVKSYIQKHLSGSVLPFVTKTALSNLNIPLPIVSVQKKIVTLLKLRAKEQSLQNALNKKQQMLINTKIKNVL